MVYAAPQKCELRDIPLPDLAPGMVEIEAICSGLSRGTERLIFNGSVPESEHSRMRAPFQTGEFPFPVVYGYASVGRVVAGPEKIEGRIVFSLGPHQERLRLPADAISVLPDGVTPERAVIAANAETALNAIWDAEIPPGARVLVVGAGLLGCLVAALLSMRLDLSVFVLDRLPQRSAKLAEFPVSFITTTERLESVALAFHTSASAGGLQTAMDALAFEGRVIELSWFGDSTVSLRLGGSFHANRLTIQSSQVGHVARPRRMSTSHGDRLCRALELLADPRFDAFVTEEVAFEDLAEAMPRLLAQDAPGIATRIRY
ncbi:MAG: zinc-binding alcohol dehydrogenase [Pseudomonadota bacterium]